MTSMNELEFEFDYPADFQEETKDEILPELPPFKASAILYVTSGAFLFGGLMLPIMDALARSRDYMPATFIELLAWNPFSEIGVIGIALGLFMFWLGLMVDRRGA